MGSELVKSHAEILEDVWQVDANIMGFVFGYPAFLPSISKANRSKARILEKMTEWHRQMESVGGIATPNAENGRFEDVSDLMKQRQRIWSKHRFSMRDCSETAHSSSEVTCRQSDRSTGTRRRSAAAIRPSSSGSEVMRQ